MKRLKKKAIFDLRGEGAPGPDGLPIVFFPISWDLIQDEILQFFKEFHDNGQISGTVGASSIAFIPKKEGALSMRDFHPISLIKSLHKILATVLANRLQKVLPYVISDNQGAFVNGRQNLDSVLVAHECVDSRNRQQTPRVVCKMDFEKAYDMVDWDFLRYMLARMGFGEKWKSRIHGYVSSARFSVLIDDSPKGFFRSSRWLRQGCPLSPMLFVILVEALHVTVENPSKWLLCGEFPVGGNSFAICK